MFRTCLQTITWGDPQHDRFDAIFARARAAGFDGLEIGFRRLSARRPADIAALLDRHGLALVASHIGGNLGDLGQAENERADFAAALDRLAEAGVPYLLYSGLNEPDDDGLDAAINRLNGFADRAAAAGVQLLFHNHDWEFHDDARIWRRLLADGAASLGYALDLGWAAKAGADLEATLDTLGPRAKVLHFKDFISDAPGQNTCHLGEGIIDFAPAWTWLDRQDQAEIWVTAEQDHAKDPDIACDLNAAYLRRHLAALGNTPC